MKTSARFIFEDARVIRVKELPRVCFLTVLVQAGKFPDYEECVLFQPPSFPLVEGEVVTVTGDIQKKKPKEGSREWTVEFIGREVKKGDASKAPSPKRSFESREPSAATKTQPQEDDDIAF
jgi:hypothetical protein